MSAARARQLTRAQRQMPIRLNRIHNNMLPTIINNHPHNNQHHIFCGASSFIYLHLLSSLAACTLHCPQSLILLLISSAHQPIIISKLVSCSCFLSSWFVFSWGEGRFWLENVVCDCANHSDVMLEEMMCFSVPIVTLWGGGGGLSWGGEEEMHECCS